MIGCLNTLSTDSLSTFLFSFASLATAPPTIRRRWVESFFTFVAGLAFSSIFLSYIELSYLLIWMSFDLSPRNSKSSSPMVYCSNKPPFCSALDSDVLDSNQKSRLQSVLSKLKISTGPSSSLQDLPSNASHVAERPGSITKPISAYFESKTDSHAEKLKAAKKRNESASKAYVDKFFAPTATTINSVWRGRKRDSGISYRQSDPARPESQLHIRKLPFGTGRVHSSILSSPFTPTGRNFKRESSIGSAQN